MKNSCFIVLFLLGIIPSAFAQLIGFEEEVPEAFTVSGKGEVKISSLFYKEGESSLEWDFQPGSTLDVQIAPLSLNTRNEKQFGITLWIYNEKPQQDSIRFEFLNKEGEVSYWFSYRLQAAGWRACWISFEYMQGDKKDKKIVAYRLVAPQRKGRIFLDRLIFPEKKMNLRTIQSFTEESEIGRYRTAYHVLPDRYLRPDCRYRGGTGDCLRPLYETCHGDYRNLSDYR